MKHYIILAALLLGVWLPGNAQEEKPALVLQKGHSTTVVSLAFAANGRLLISGERSGVVKVWELRDLRNGRNLRDIYLSSELRDDFAVNAGGRIVFTPGKGECAFWDFQDGKKKSAVQCGDKDYTYTRAFSFPTKSLTVVEQSNFAVSDFGRKKSVFLEGGIHRAFAAAYSPDGKILAVAHYRSEEFVKNSGQTRFKAGEFVELYEAETGKLLRAMNTVNFTGSITKLLFSADGKTLAAKTSELGVFNGKSNVIVWDAGSGAQKAIYDAGFVPLNFALSHNGMTLVVGAENGKISLYENNSPVPRQFDNQKELATAFAFSADGKILAAGGANGSLNLYDAATGALLASLGSKILPVSSAAIDDDNRHLLIAQKNYSFTMGGGYEFDSSTKIFDTEGSLKNGFTPKSKYGVQISDILYAPDGKSFLMSWGTLGAPGVDGVYGGFIRAKTDGWQPLLLGTGKEKTYPTFAFSRDGKMLATGGAAGAVNVWNVAQNKLLYQIPDKWEGGVNLTSNIFAFTPDGKTLIRAGDDSKIRFFDAASGQPQKVSDFTIKNVRFQSFSPDAQSIAFNTISNDEDQRKVYLWNIAEGKVTHTFSGHAGEVGSAVFTADGRILISTDEGGNVKFWNVAEQREVANLVVVGDNDWVVTTPEGFFDGTPNAWNKLFWRFDNDIFKLAPLEAFFNEFYYPNLLKEILDGNAPAAPKKNISEIDRRQPLIRVAQIDEQNVAEKNSNDKSPVEIKNRTVKVTVEIVENNQKPPLSSQSPTAGVKDARLFRNGSLVKHWKGDVFDKASGCETATTKANEPRRAFCKTDLTVSAGANDLTVYAFNRENVKSVSRAVAVKGADVLKRAGILYVLAIGVNRYKDASHNLKFAVADADAISGEIFAQQSKLKSESFADVKVVKLTDEKATRENILQALQRFSTNAPQINLTGEIGRELGKINQAQPEDALVVYYAGHGTASKDRFYLIPHDGFPVDGTLDETYLQFLYERSVSDEEIEQALETVEAGKILVIVDACNSGQALNAEEQRRGPMNSRGLAQLAYEKGIYILTAAQSEQAALEVSKFGHGLLTYSLLEGLKKADRSANGAITERNWFDYAVREVPQLQIDEMRKRDAEIKTSKSGSRSGVVFIKGANKNLSPEKRGLQTPRIFYRREAEENPFIIARP